MAANNTADALQLTVRNQCAIVALNRPEIRNALDDRLIAGLTRTLKALDADDSVRAVVLTGSGTAFCAGADLNWMMRMAGYSAAQNYKDALALASMLQTLDRMRKPTIARVHGPAFAGGVGLVAACDIAVGSTDAQFALTEAKLGLSPATVSPYVVRAIGERAAHRYFLTGERFSAAEAYRLGLLSELCQPEELDDRVDALLGHIVAGGRVAHAKIKELIRAVSRGAIDAAMIKGTARDIAEIRASQEGREGIASFLEKRKPNWVAQVAAPQEGAARGSAPPPARKAGKATQKK